MGRIYREGGKQIMEYSEKVVDHYTNPRNVGKIEDENVYKS